MLLTPLFERAFHWLFGWSVQEFVFYRPDGTINSNIPFSSQSSVVLLTIVYLVSIFWIQKAMKSRPAPSLKPAFAVHNILLSFFSLVLLVLLLETLVPIFLERGFYFAICAPEMWHGAHGRRLELYYYINYLFKFYELGDTYFMALSKKKLEFLHVYHHSATFWLCFSQLLGNTSVQWFVITLNLLVHVLMYYYYARAALGVQVWWKKYLTTLQIVQFLLDLFIVFYCTITHFAGLYYPDVFGRHDCHGSEVAAFIGCGILSSYLVLFIQFFQQTYSARREAAKKKN
jgi:hypothetical protein